MTTFRTKPLAQTREISDWIDHARRNYELTLRDDELKESTWVYENDLNETLLWDEVIDE